MCLGIPMQVQAIEPGFASCRGRGETRRVTTALIGAVRVGDWVLVFKDAAVERLDATRAAEVDAALDLVAAALAGSPAAHAAPAFVLPSALSAEQIAALVNSQEAS
jgi:hydrogenase expression/formation protein HypC